MKWIKKLNWLSEFTTKILNKIYTHYKISIKMFAFSASEQDGTRFIFLPKTKINKNMKQIFKKLDVRQ